MGRSLTTIVRQELANLDKDAESRRSAMKALKTHVKDLDSKAIPLFMEKVSQSKETGLSGECSISLYEVLARVHGPKIVPQIPSIMASIVKTLSSSAGSFPLQQACSRVVPAIARYAIGPNTTEPKKKSIIRSLGDPLADSLSASRESLASGAALCLKALVDAENWRFASDEMVNKVCRVVAVALERKPTQTNSHMGLAMTLAKRNPVVVEPYAGLLIRAGIQILNSGLAESNSQKRLSAIQLVNFLMRWLDRWSLFSELGSIMEEMEKCQSDQMAYVRGAAFEALQTAKRISAETMKKNTNNDTPKFFPKSPVSVKSCFFSGPASPESRTLESSLVDYEESWSESPRSTINSFDRRSVSRKLWCFENGGVDVSLKDGLFSRIARESSVSDPSSERSKDEECEEFAGFVMKNLRPGISRSTTTSPLKSRGSIDVNDIIFSTPRKLIHSLQDPAKNSSSEKPARKIRSLSFSDFEWSPVSECGQNYSPRYGSLYVNNDAENKSLGRPESDVSSSLENNAERQTCTKETEDQKIEDTTQRPKFGVLGLGSEIGLKFVFVPLFVLLAVFAFLVWLSERSEFDDHFLVPT